MKKDSESINYLIPELNEAWFREFWHYQCINDEKMRTEDGRSLRVLYPGRPNDIQGADFKDAVVKSGKSLLKGDVEIHLKPGDWHAHHHHLDARYNSVMLHVVLQPDTQKETTLQNGDKIPVLNLKKHLPLPAGPDTSRIKGLPCSRIAEGKHREKLLSILDQAGEERFLEKAAGFTRDIRNYGKGETLYRAIMKALGYSANGEPFEKLASLVSLKELEIARNRQRSEEEYLVTLRLKLFGAAGFLEGNGTNHLTSSGISPSDIEELKKIWQLSNGTVLLSAREWQFFRIRPVNSPLRRLNAMCVVLSNYRERGLLDGILDAAGTIESLKDCRKLETGLVTASTPDEFPGSISLIGKSRASVMIVNILLPFLYAEISGQVTAYRESLMTTYRKYPKLPENSLERHMAKQFGLEQSVLNTAVRQQGMIYIYRNYCTQGRCARCASGQLQAGENIQ